MRWQSIISALALCSLAGAAGAADMELKGPAAPARLPGWTGLYFGIHGGVFDGSTKVEEDGIVTEHNARTNGMIGGGLAGYNWQMGLWVLGLEGDIGYTNAHGTGNSSNGNRYDYNWIGHVRGRAGYDYLGWLLFVAGGVATADFTFTPGESSVQALQGAQFTGFTVGGGVERMVLPYLGVRVEYLYDDFGSKTYQTADSYKVSLTGSIVRGAIILKLP